MKMTESGGTRGTALVEIVADTRSQRPDLLAEIGISGTAPTLVRQPPLFA